jgi:hypothetical protein
MNSAKRPLRMKAARNPVRREGIAAKGEKYVKQS